MQLETPDGRRPVGNQQSVPDLQNNGPVGQSNPTTSSSLPINQFSASRPEGVSQSSALKFDKSNISNPNALTELPSDSTAHTSSFHHSTKDQSNEAQIQMNPSSVQEPSCDFDIKSTTSSSEVSSSTPQSSLASTAEYLTTSLNSQQVRLKDQPSTSTSVDSVIKKNLNLSKPPINHNSSTMTHPTSTFSPEKFNFLNPNPHPHGPNVGDSNKTESIDSSWEIVERTIATEITVNTTSQSNQSSDSGCGNNESISEPSEASRNQQAKLVESPIIFFTETNASTNPTTKQKDPLTSCEINKNPIEDVQPEAATNISQTKMVDSGKMSPDPKKGNIMAKYNLNTAQTNCPAYFSCNPPNNSPTDHHVNRHLVKTKVPPENSQENFDYQAEAEKKVKKFRNEEKLVTTKNSSTDPQTEQQHQKSSTLLGPIRQTVQNHGPPVQNELATDQEKLDLSASQIVVTTNETEKPAEGQSKPSLRAFFADKGVVDKSQNPISKTQPLDLSPTSICPPVPPARQEIPGAIAIAPGSDIHQGTYSPRKNIALSSLKVPQPAEEKNLPKEIQKFVTQSTQSIIETELSQCRDEIKSILRSNITQLFRSVTIEQIAMCNWMSLLNTDELQRKIKEGVANSKVIFSLPFTVINDIINKELTSCPLNLLCTFLYQNFVKPLDERFKNNFDLSIKKLDGILSRQAQAAREQIDQQLGLELASHYRNHIDLKLEEYSLEYREQIQELKRHEKEADDNIIEALVKHYNDETLFLFLLDDKYFDEKKLNEIHDEILNESLQILEEVCGFQDAIKNRMIKGVLRAKIEPLYKNLVSRNEENRRKLEKKLIGFLNVAMEHYSKMMGKEEYQHLEGFMSTHRQTLESSQRKLQTEILNSGKKYPPDMIKEVESILVKYFEQSRLTAFRYFEEFAAKEADEKRQREAAEIEARKKIEMEAKERKEMEQQREAKARVENVNLPMEIPKKGKTSPTELKQNKDSVVRPIQSTAPPQVASTSTSRSSNPRTATTRIPPLLELPEMKVAIHLGLHRTKLGFKDSAGEFHMLFDLENILYLDERQMVSFKEGEADQKSLQNKFSFVGLLMQEKLDEIYQVKFSTGEFKEFRIEEILSFFLTQLKWKAELELKRRIPECLIVVPQSLNMGQREAVTASVKLAKFERHSIINDTHAMALAFLFEDRHRFVNATRLITANLFEGFIDATSFKLDHDLIHVATSGEYFIPEDNSYGWGNLALDIFTLGFRRWFIKTPDELQKKSKKIFCPEELQVYPGYSTVTVLSTPKELLGKWKLLQKQNVVHVDENYALMGATYLVRLAESNLNDRIYQIWRKRITQSDFQAFRRNLTYGYPEKYNYKPSSNTVRGRNLCQRDFSRIEFNYFLHDQNRLHDAKLEVLKMLSNLEPLNGLHSYQWRGLKVDEYMNECSVNLQMGLEIPLADILEMCRILQEMYMLISSGTI